MPPKLLSPDQVNSNISDLGTTSHRRKAMDSTTPLDLSRKVPAQIEETMQTLVESFHDRPNRKAQLRNSRLDKLLLQRGHERQNRKDR